MSPAASVFIVISAPSVTPPVARRKSTLPLPILSSVKIFPLRVTTPDVVNVKYSSGVVVPIAGKVIAWFAVFIVNPSLPALLPFIAEPNVTAPPVPKPPASVSIITSAARVIPPVAPLKSTLPVPTLSSVKIFPLSVTTPDVVAVNDFKAFVVPTLLRFIFPVPAMSSNDSVPAPFASTELLNVIFPAPPGPVLKITSPVKVTGEAKLISVLVVSIMLFIPSPEIETFPVPV